MPRVHQSQCHLLPSTMLTCRRSHACIGSLPSARQRTFALCGLRLALHPRLSLNQDCLLSGNRKILICLLGHCL